MAIMMYNSLYTHESKSYKEEKKNYTNSYATEHDKVCYALKKDKLKGSLVLVIPFAAEWLPSFPVRALNSLVVLVKDAGVVHAPITDVVKAA